MGQAPSQENERDASQNLEMVADKVKNLKCQGEKLTKALFAKMDELSVECQKALEASNNSNHVASMVAYRLDSFSELLDNEMLKLQGNETSPTQTNPGEQIFSSLSKRIEEVEASQAKLEKLGADFQKAHKESTSSTQLKSDVQQLESRVNTLSGTFLQLRFDISETQRKTLAIPEMEKTLETLSTDLDLCRSESEQIKTLMIEQEAVNIKQRKKMKSQLNSIKQQFGSVKNEKDTAVLVLSKKMSNLEKLRDILNKDRAGADTTRPDLKQMCEDANAQIAKLEDDITRLKRHPVGFTAHMNESRYISKSCQINRLFDIVSDIGDCFKPFQGQFIAPYDGLYCFCVKLEADNNGKYTACLMTKDVHEEGSEELEIPMYNDSPHSAICVLELAANKRVYVKIKSVDKSFKLMRSFAFSGWSLGYA